MFNHGAAICGQLMHEESSQRNLKDRKHIRAKISATEKCLSHPGNNFLFKNIIFSTDLGNRRQFWRKLNFLILWEELVMAPAVQLIFRRKSGISLHNFYVGEDAWFGEGAGAVVWGLYMCVCVWGGRIFIYCTKITVNNSCERVEEREEHVEFRHLWSNCVRDWMNIRKHRLKIRGRTMLYFEATRTIDFNYINCFCPQYQDSNLQSAGEFF